MNWLYSKIMSWALGEAIANSDRVKIGVVTALTALAAQLIPVCGFCPAILTPALLDKIAAAIVVLGLKLIHSLDHRDIAAPGETVVGEAIPDSELPPPPADALGVPGAPIVNP